MKKSNSTSSQLAVTYKRFPPGVIFLSFSPSELSEAELWQGARLAPNKRNRMTGIEMFDIFTNFVATHLHSTTAMYARRMGLSPRCLDETLIALTGLTTNEWVSEYVMLCARELIASPHNKIGEIATLLHFSSQQGFNKFFTLRQGMSPLEYRYKCIRTQNKKEREQ